MSPVGCLAFPRPLDRLRCSHFRRFLEAVAEVGNRGTLQRQPFRFMDALEDSLSELKGRLESLGLTPQMEAPPELSPVYADRSYLTRILQVLL